MDTGWLTFSVGAESNCVGATKQWTNINNALNCDNSYATCGPVTGANEDTYCLILTKLNPQAPFSSAVVVGIEVEIDCYTTTGGTASMQVQLLKGGSGIGNWTGWSSNLPAGSEGTMAFGGASNLWGYTSQLILNDFNKTDGGIRFYFRGSAGDGVDEAFYVDCARIKIHYLPIPAFFI